MGRRPQFEHAFGDPAAPTRVGYSAKPRNGRVSVRFNGPDGRPVVRQTSAKAVDFAFHAEAVALIKAAYGPAAALDDAMTVAAALDAVLAQSPHLRPATHAAYKNAVASLARCCPAARTLGAVDAAAAASYSRLFLATPFSRHRDGSKAARHSPTSLSAYLRSLAALWARFVDHGFVLANPWAAAKKPEVKKVRKPVPTEHTYAQFIAWLRARYPAWDALHALIELKSFTCCRTADVVQLRADQVRDGRVFFDAHQVKTAEARSVPLPPPLFQTLKAVSGKDWLWGRLYDEAPKFRPTCAPRKTARPPFRAEAVGKMVGHLFREYRKAHPGCEHLTPHSLRRRGITLLVARTQNVDLAAQAVGVNAATARAHYLDSQRAFDADAVYAKWGGDLLPAVSGAVQAPGPVPATPTKKPAAKNTTKTRAKPP